MMDENTNFQIEDGVLVRYRGYGSNVVIPEGVKSIGNFAFYDAGLSSVHIPRTVTHIGENAFAFSKNLRSIDIPDSVTVISSFVFYHCENLQTVTMGDSVRVIGASAFKDCLSLREIRISDHILKIGSEAFSNCPKLEKFSFGGKFKIVFDCFLYHFDPSIPPYLTHLVLGNPSDFHPDDIRYAFERAEKRYDFQTCIAELSYAELLTMERYGLITNENAQRILEILRGSGNVECVNEMIRYLTKHRTIEDYMHQFDLRLEES